MGRLVTATLGLALLALFWWFARCPEASAPPDAAGRAVPAEPPAPAGGLAGREPRAASRDLEKPSAEGPRTVAPSADTEPSARLSGGRR
jgi:hypothetical protein